jgi:hypothetical protein
VQYAVKEQERYQRCSSSSIGKQRDFLSKI